MGGGLIASSPATSDDQFSTFSTDSMVEIKPTPPHTPHEDDAKFRLIYSRSKVYVHPTAYSRDNIPGFVALVRKEEINPSYFIAWIPESLLDERGPEEWEKYVKVETKEGESSVPPDDLEHDAILVELPSRGESYAFSVPISSVYSLIVNAPTLSAWYGSVTIHLSNGTTLPALYFHDDESRSVPPPSRSSRLSTWGGEDLIQRLRSYAHLLRSTLQNNLFLVDPSRQDIETHSTILYSDTAVDEILSPSSPIPVHRRPRPLRASSSRENNRNSILHQTSPVARAESPGKMAFLQSFSNLTRATRHAAQQILSHPLAKPIVPHLPDPVKSLVNVNGEWASWVEKGGVGEFESARVYLARWARIVAEEGERARQREAQALPSAPGEQQESSDLGVFELLHSTTNLPTPKPTRDPKHPVDRKTWDGWFNQETGRPIVAREEMQKEVFRRGLAHDVRRIAWPFILGVVPWDSDNIERQQIWEVKRETYEEFKSQWCGVEEVFEREDVLEERHRIDVDCRRTDRSQPLFAAARDPTASRYPTFAPSNSDIGAQSPSNEHVEALGVILLTYGFYERELGYVQGMSDLCAPIYVVMGADEPTTFWCFVEVMERMKMNFLRDQSGMKKHLLTMQQLLAVMDPELYRHLGATVCLPWGAPSTYTKSRTEKAEALNLFFCFRWVLIAFKREFPFDEILRLWEVLWTEYYSSNFVLFIVLAVLESHRDVILRYLVEFDEILKYCNELSMTIELDSTLAQAEVLFLSFAQLVADIDRRKAEEGANSEEGLRRRRGGQQELTAANLPSISENLRDLLKNGR